ncbi:hypothetical protein, partial [Escherichia coli]|uniref:hypothetical protein n=1 Tax=Escherichia coli TaxID=562 RepID=UPI001BFEE94D
KTSIFSHPVYLFLRKFSLQDSRGGSISRSTLYFWSTPDRMPAGFTCPFPKPTIPGNPKRWRESEIVSWEMQVNASKVDTQ